MTKWAFLRILSLDKGHAKEIFSTKLESCRDGIELMVGGGVEFDAQKSELTLRWLRGPKTKGAVEEELVDLKSLHH